MSFEDNIKAIKAELEEAEKKEAGVEVEEVEEPTEEPTEAPTETPTEEPTQPPEEVKLDDSGYARLRREAAAAKKKADEESAKRAELEAEMERLKNPDAEVVEETVNTEIAEVVQEMRLRKAEREFLDLEANFKSKVPDYDAVASDYIAALAQSIKVQNPRYTQAQVAEKTKEAVLVKAAGYLKAGYDPIEEMYHDGKELGFGKKAAEPKEEKPEEIKPDMKKVAANRARSTGMAASNGRSEPQLTPTAASNLNVAAFTKLSKAEKQAVYAQLANQ
jgi:hypothetical protein